MSQALQRASWTADCGEPERSEIFDEVVEPEYTDSVVLLRNYRGIHPAGAPIHREMFLVESGLEQLIRTYHGYSYQSAGIVTGFFEETETAQRCAAAITANYHKTVEVCGTQVTITM